MTITRFIVQADEKIHALCVVLHRHAAIASADTKALALKADIPYTTLISAIEKGRFSSELESKLARLGRFDSGHRSWVDDSVPEVSRRADKYLGDDSAAQFRKHITDIWSGTSISFRTERSLFKAFDPHMAKHHLSDGLQTTPASEQMQLFFSVQLQPFHHRSGIQFGFRKVAVMMEIECRTTRATGRLGHPGHAEIGNAQLQGEVESPLIRWILERKGGESEMLSGEYATTEQPLVTLAGYADGTAITSAIDVNLFDRTSFASDVGLEFSGNKQEMIEQIFLRELPAAQDRNGWITISCERIVVARYGK